MFFRSVLIVLNVCMIELLDNKQCYDDVKHPAAMWKTISCDLGDHVLATASSTYTKIGTIWRTLTWPLCMDDMKRYHILRDVLA